MNKNSNNSGELVKKKSFKEIILGKLFFRTHVIFIESSANILKPTAGRKILIMSA